MIDKVLKVIRYSVISLVLLAEIGFIKCGQGFLFTPLALASIYYFLTEN